MYGTIEGLVVDSQDMPLANANVFIPQLERGASTDSDGKFIINQLTGGTYKVAVQYIGYRPETKNVTITAGSTSHVQFTMLPSPIASEPIVITGRPIAADPLDSPQDISYISGREKTRLQSTSLGKTIESIPGAYNMSAGSVAGKPVLRGQTGERVLILSDGIVQEYQQYGERHAPNLDPFNSERIEIIKGAASLLYGSDALGGAVNLVPHQFHIASGERAEFDGLITTAYHSNNNEYVAAAKVHSALGNVGLNGTLVRRSSGDFNTPTVDTYSETGERGDPKFAGEIDHTDFEQINGSLSLGILTRVGLFSANYDHYSSENNFLLPAGTPIGLRLQNQIANVKASIPLGRFLAKPRFSYQRNHRQAAHPGESRDALPDSAQVDLILDVYTGRVELQHTQVSGLSGTLGGEVKYYDHENVGVVPLQPTGHFTNLALFGFEEWQADRLTFNLGARFDHRSQEFVSSTTNPLLPDDDRKTFSSLSGAAGASYRLSETLTAAANAGRGFRTPSFYNMYVYGYHGGVFAYQIGNPALKSETSLDVSTSLRFRNQRAEGSATLFHNRISDYIFLYNAPDHPLAPVDEPFVFAHDQADAALTGFDVIVKAGILDWLIIGGDYSHIGSEFSSGIHRGSALPLMPADRISGELRALLPQAHALKAPYLLARMTHVGDKAAAGIYEPFGQFDDGIGPDIPFGVCSTDSYTLINFGIGFDVAMMGRLINVDLEMSNALDTVYRDFLDTYKGYALSPGRSLNVKVNVPLGN